MLKHSKPMLLAILLCGILNLLPAISSHADTAANPATTTPTDTSAEQAKKDAAEQKSEQAEGKDAADQIAKTVKFVTDKATVDRITSIGKKLGDIADNVVVPAGFGNSKIYHFDYTYKIINEKEINAFSLPGGHIYIYKGLLDLLTTDDEIAGVLGHETAHAAHHHVAELEHQSSKMGSQLLLGALVAAIAHVPIGDIGNLYAGASYAQQAELNNHYSEAAEEDADHTGMIYMQKAGYNPVGMLALLQRLKDVEDRSPDVELGYLQDHPLTSQRLASARAELSQLGATVTTASMREATGLLIAKVTDNGAISDVNLGSQLVFQVPLTSHDEAVSAANKLNTLLDSNLQLYQVKADGATLLARDEPLIQFTDADVKAQTSADAPSSPEAMAEQAASTIKRLLWNQSVTTPTDTYVPIAVTIK